MCLGGGGKVEGVNLGFMGYTSQSRVGGEISRKIIAAVLTSFHPNLGSTLEHNTHLLFPVISLILWRKAQKQFTLWSIEINNFGYFFSFSGDLIL